MAYLGIDLGTTNSVATIYRDKDDSIEIVKIDGTDEVLPSVVNYPTLESEEVVVGSEAKLSSVIYPESTVISIKRKIGTDNKIIINGEEKTPEQVSAEILKKLK